MWFWLICIGAFFISVLTSGDEPGVSNLFKGIALVMVFFKVAFTIIERGRLSSGTALTFGILGLVIVIFILKNYTKEE